MIENSSLKTDVDFTLFIDIDEYRNQYAENIQKNKSFAMFEISRLMDSYQNTQERQFLSQISQKISENQPISLEDRDHLSSFLKEFSPHQFLFFLSAWHNYSCLHPEITKETFSFYGKTNPRIERMKDLLWEKDIQALPIQEEGEFSLLEQIRKASIRMDLSKKENDDQKSKYIFEQERIGIAKIFGLDIGGGMKKYRQKLIRDLLLLPQEEGEHLWRIIDDAVRFSERKHLIPESTQRQFPKTLTDAVSQYI